MSRTNNPLLPFIDPFGMTSSFSRLGLAWLNNYPQFLERLCYLTAKWTEMSMVEFDKAFSSLITNNQDPGTSNGNLISLSRLANGTGRNLHSLLTDWLMNMIDDAPNLEEKDRQKCAFWSDQLFRALGPSNFFWTNPGAVQRYLTSEGKSLERCLQNILDDLSQGENLISLVDDSEFRLGQNIASTPGAVVFRNELMELIQYYPTTKDCFKTPIVFIQPWINKYYIFDLSSHNSLVSYLVNQGFPVFITSWKNPDKDMYNVSFEDYMFKGIWPAIQVANQICDTSKVHAAGYCIGGTALAAMMAWFNAEDQSDQSVPVATWTLFSTLTDYSEPGVLGVFTDEHGLEMVEGLIGEKGYLDARYISFAFRLLKPDSLIWRYMVNNYFFGQKPPKSDMLFWNSDSTRLPRTMCLQYLEDFYLNNRMIRPREMVFKNKQIDLGSIVQPVWNVGCEQDHIIPWQGTFRTCLFLNCPVKYVLANEGHITGIVNPPSARSRKKYRIGQIDQVVDPKTWHSEQEVHYGSWWPDWVQWLIENSQLLDSPPSVGNHKFPVLEPAPGTYVFEK